MELSAVWDYMRPHNDEPGSFKHQIYSMHALYLSLHKERSELEFKTIALRDKKNKPIDQICLIYDPMDQRYWGYHGLTNEETIKAEMLTYYQQPQQKEKIKRSRFQQPFYYDSLTDESDCKSVFFQICDDQDYLLADQAVGYAKSKTQKQALDENTSSFNLKLPGSHRL
jgi:hypothetical protein